MFKVVIFIFSFASAIIHPVYSSSITPQGVAAPSKISFPPSVSQHSDSELIQMVQKAIQVANPKHVGMGTKSARELAKEVVRTAQCYHVDPIIFSALLWRESNFKHTSISERGAIGLTQMTSLGVQEVLERLSESSWRKSPSLRLFAQRCHPGLLARIPYETSADTVAAWRNNISQSSEDALVMGAMLLRINLMGIKTQQSTIETYKIALEHYNGDPREKVHFANDVLQIAKRMATLPQVALADSRFLSSIEAF